MIWLPPKKTSLDPPLAWGDSGTAVMLKQWQEAEVWRLPEKKQYNQSSKIFGELVHVWVLKKYATSKYSNYAQLVCSKSAIPPYSAVGEHSEKSRSVSR